MFNQHVNCSNIQCDIFKFLGLSNQQIKTQRKAYIDFITVLNRKKAAYSDTVEAWAGECLALGFISSPELFLIN